MNTLIDPNDVTDFERSDVELELFALFCCVVAGKNAVVQAQKLNAFLGGRSPFGYLRQLIREKALRKALEEVRMGQYLRLERVFTRLVDPDLNLRTAPLPELESFMGMKTSRFFLVHTRPEIEAAILDTHILSWLRERGHDAPGSTPGSKKQYLHWEDIFLEEWRKQKMPLADFDLWIWKSQRQPKTLKAGIPNPNRP